MQEEHNDNGPPHPGAQPDVKLSYRASRILAIKELLTEKHVISPAELETAINSLKSRKPTDGAKVIARAWKDPSFKQRLIENPELAINELGYALDQHTRLIVVENTVSVHNVIVCTLCSCYPISLLGPPPDWYKSFGYRSRVVKNPRSVIGEFGLILDTNIEVRVHDSTADIRYLVLPMQPTGTSQFHENQLTELVTRDSMIGVSVPSLPNQHRDPD